MSAFTSSTAIEPLWLARARAHIGLHEGVGDAVTAEQTAIVRLIRQGYQFTAAVDAAAATILAAGDAADPVSSDARWPAVPAAG